MNKKLLVVAVAGALAVPGIALAQVTISGRIGALYQNISLSGATVARAGGTSFGHISDNGSSLDFRFREDLGGGLAAYGQYNARPTTDGGTLVTGTGAAAQWIGLESTSWGNLRFGTLTGLHYVTGPDFTGTTGTAYNSVQAMTGGNAVPGNTYAMATRLRNAVAWDSLNYGGFKMTVAYSTSGAGADVDLGRLGRKGQTWNLIPQFIQKDWNIGYSYYDQKPDTGAAALAGFNNEKGQRLFGDYNFGNGFRLGGSWDSYKQTNVGTGVKATDRRAWSLQGMYVTGPHQIAAHFAKAQDDKVLGANTNGKSMGVAYQYSLSKRTNTFVSYQKITNAAGAAYGTGGLQTPAYTAATGFAVVAGEDVTNLMFGVNHSF